jgi:hypothetical protein
LNAVTLVGGANLAILFISLLTGWWGTFGRGWPFELLLVGLGLAMLMEAIGSIWLLIPTGIILGTGYLMSFYSLTNAWTWWSFLWPLQVLVVGGSVWAAVRLADEPERADEVSGRLFQAVRRPTLVWLVIVVVLGAILG